MAPRLSTLIEVQALSLATQVKFDKNDIDKSITNLKNVRIAADATISKLFKTIGTATNVRINEQWGVQPIYSVGAPTRPIMVPGNYQVSVSIEKLQLDRKNAFSFFTSPDYWYSADVQNKIGQDDYLLYTYLVVRDKEKPGFLNSEIYAVMPTSSANSYSAGESTLVHNVDCMGFKLSYIDLLNLLKDKGILTYNRTAKVTASGAESVFGAVKDGTNADR